MPFILAVTDKTKNKNKKANLEIALFLTLNLFVQNGT